MSRRKKPPQPACNFEEENSLPAITPSDPREVVYVMLDYICDRDGVTLARRDGALMLIEESCRTCLANVTPKACQLNKDGLDATICGLWR